MWGLFRKYHYLNHSILSSSKCFVATINDRPVAFCAITHFVHSVIKNAIKNHRVVVLPDYQGLGIGNMLVNRIAEKVVSSGKRFIETSSQPALYHARLKDPRWIIKRKGHVTPTGSKSTISATGNSVNRITVAYEFILPKTNKK